MNMHERVGMWMTIAVFVCAGAARAPAGLQESLDAPVEIRLADSPIEKIFDQIGEKTDLAFDVSDRTLQLLPYGRRTRLSVAVPAIPLRRALDRIVQPHGLTWEPVGGTVRIVPTQPLLRMCRRTTYDELKILGALLTHTIRKIPEPGTGSVVLRGLTKNPSVNLIFPEGMGKEDVVERYRRAGLYLPSPAAEWLDGLCGRDMTWYIDAHRIFIIDRRRQALRQVGRKVSLEFREAAIRDVLLELARLANLGLSLEPGVLKTLSPGSRTITLVMENRTIRQALEIVSGTAGIEVEITADGGIYAGAAQGLSRMGTAAEREPGFFIQTRMKSSTGREIRIYLRPDEVPESVRKAIAAEKRKILGELEKHLSLPEDGTVPEATAGEAAEAKEDE